MRKKDEAEKMSAAEATATDVTKKASESTEDIALKRDRVIERTVSREESEKSIDPEYGVEKQVFLRRKHEYAKGMQFLGLVNLEKIMMWLGPDFYAVTQGDPIAINNQVIKLDNKTQYGLMKDLLLIIHDKVANCYHVVSDGSWVIYDDDFGYKILTEAKLNEVYRKVYIDAF